MPKKLDERRSFLKSGAMATAGLLTASAAVAAEKQDSEQQEEERSERETPAENATQAVAGEAPTDQKPAQDDGWPQDLKEFSRYRPSLGGPPGSSTYLGKLVPGRRGPGLPPVPVETPDVPQLPWKMVDGRKEFHIYCQHVRRGLLPGNWMDLWGFNGTMPGPTIEVNQGDKVRFVVHNHLPEATTVHWHGIELPIEEDGAVTLTQDLIMPGQTYVYEYDLHQAGTFFYHSHMPMQEAFGMVGFLIIHPAVAFEPVVDRGMRPEWHEGVKGLMTVVRVLPDDLYDLVMNSDEPVEPGYTFREITERRKKPAEKA